jgi:outer membrane biosynthesis protein TonB
MKRCPQCEFIYEDDQSLCDMDGVLLVFDSRTLPNHHALTTVPPVSKTQRRNRAVPAFATLILALVLGMVYYVSTQRTHPSVTPDTLSIAPIEIPTPELPPTQASEPTIEVKEEPKPAAVKQSTTAPARKPATKNTTPVSETKPAKETKKDDNKVNSILKKTGRILKKPFKF